VTVHTNAIVVSSIRISTADLIGGGGNVDVCPGRQTPSRRHCHGDWRRLCYEIQGCCVVKVCLLWSRPNSVALIVFVFAIQYYYSLVLFFYHFIIMPKQHTHVIWEFRRISAQSSLWRQESRWYLAWRLPSTYPKLCCKEIWVSPIIQVFPSGTLSQTLDLENFAAASRSGDSSAWAACSRIVRDAFGYDFVNYLEGLLYWQ